MKIILSRRSIMTVANPSIHTTVLIFFPTALSSHFACLESKYLNNDLLTRFQDIQTSRATSAHEYKPPPPPTPRVPSINSIFSKVTKFSPVRRTRVELHLIVILIRAPIVHREVSIRRKTLTDSMSRRNINRNLRFFIFNNICSFFLTFTSVLVSLRSLKSFPHQRHRVYPKKIRSGRSPEHKQLK